MTGRRAQRGEQGLSLVELLISMLLLGIVAAMVTGLYVSTMRGVTYAQALSANTRSVSNGMNEMARVIRAATDNPVSGPSLSAPALESATGEAVTFYAYVNLSASGATQPPIKVRLNLDADRRLVQTTYPALPLASGFYSFSSTPASSRILTDALAPTGSPAGAPSLFRYLRADGTAIAPTPAGLTAAQRRLVASVSISVTVTNGSTDARTWVTLQNTVGMPNRGLSLAGL